MAWSPFHSTRYQLGGLSNRQDLNGTKGRITPPATNTVPDRLVFTPENGGKALLVKLENLRFVQESPLSLDQQKLSGISDLKDRIKNILADRSSHLYLSSPCFSSMSHCVPTDQQIRHMRRALEAASDWTDTAADIVPALLAHTYQENGFLLKAASAVDNGELLYLVHHALTSTQEICEHLRGFDASRVYRCTERNRVGYMLNTRSEQDLVHQDVRKAMKNMCLPPRSLILVFPFVQIEQKHAHVRFGMRIFRPEDLDLRVERPGTLEDACRIAEDNADHKQRLCASCLRMLPNLEYCAGCKKVFYCCKDCQKKDWPLHKSYCKQVQKARQSA